MRTSHAGTAAPVLAQTLEKVSVGNMSVLLRGGDLPVAGNNPHNADIHAAFNEG